MAARLIISPIKELTVSFSLKIKVPTNIATIREIPPETVNNIAEETVLAHKVIS